jgi:hypothetical protein
MRISLFLMVFIITTFLFSSPVSAWLDNYDYRMPIEINNTGNNLTNYQYNFTIDTASLVSTGKMNVNGSDCRITNNTDVLQEFWNETPFNDSNTKIWVNATELGNITNTTHYIYYGKPGATDITNISAAFDFGDSFSIDTLERISESSNPTRTPDDAWEGAEVNEFSNFNYGGEYISWYRGNHGGTYETGFENSTDGVTWTGYSGNPILTTPQVYSYVVNDSGCFYLFNNHDATANGNGNMYMYNVTDYTNPIIMNGGNPVYTRSAVTTDWDYRIFNPGITIDGDGRWHMLLEGKTDTSGFKIGYAYSNFTELNWSLHRSSSYVIDTAGNPDLEYVADRNVLLSVHGSRPGTYWKIIASYANLSDDLTSATNWHTASNFEIVESGIHLADPSLMYNFNATYPTMLSYNYNQASIYQCYYATTLNEFYDKIIESPLENIWESASMGLYSISNGNLVMGIASPSTNCLNSKNSYNNYIIESRLKTSSGEILLEMSNAKTTIPVKERATIRIGDSFVGYINGAYTTSGTGVADTWYRSMIKVPSSGTAGAYVYSDDKQILHVSKTGTPAYTTSYIALFHTVAGIGYMDWVFVRQYTEIEPTTSLGSEEGKEDGIYIPPNPTNLQNTTGNFWIDHTWQPGVGNITNFYNVSLNNVWHNGTINTYWNVTYPYSNNSWQNITIWAYNNSGIGALSTDSISQNTQLLFTNLPTNLQQNHDHTWVNWTWNESFIGTHIIDSYNVSINGTWYNGTTNQSYNHTGLDYELTSSIIIYGYNNTQGLSIYYISDSYTFPIKNKMVNAIEQLVTPIQIIKDKFFNIIPFIISIILFAGFGLAIMVMTSRFKKW